ncbi:DUF742 domain-containing protein [Peterkaempfera bronchialis]|uniref:DUF742 domain-containing protein n=1 Tax=Peterkaempfera bronchialis TaxID=2126346 RepID=A0A345T397_9ACTN|nr:DUF742 domain-containing protein [Peterkaempfera bronchialis]AXI80452.1 DUF742 domain-containing protein [Peterkaempfera bronchialis]
MTARRRDSALVRPYVVTDGRAVPSRNTLDLVTLVRVTGSSPTGLLSPEKQALLELCRGGALSVAEISAHLVLPVGICKVLIADLVDEGLLATRSPIPRAERPDRDLVEEVLRGLRALR